MNEALWPPTKIKQPGRRSRVCLGEVDDLGDVGQVVEAERHRVGLPLVEHAQVVLRATNTCRSMMRTSCPARPGRRRHQLEPERLEPEEDLRVHEPARMTAKHLHATPSFLRDRP